MTRYRVPAVAIAVIKDRRIRWARTFGWADPQARVPVTETTVFQAGFISKPVSAFAALTHLASHTGGLTVHGFPGYARAARVPTVRQVLDGRPPANTDPVRVDMVPGEKFRYSGGGYTVMQQLMTDRFWPGSPTTSKRARCCLYWPTEGPVHRRTRSASSRPLTISPSPAHSAHPS